MIFSLNIPGDKYFITAFIILCSYILGRIKWRDYRVAIRRKTANTISIDTVFICFIRKPFSISENAVITDIVQCNPIILAIQCALDFETSFCSGIIIPNTGASSPGWFPNLLRGRINLTSIYIVKIIQLLEMSSRESEYFELLVSFNQAGNPDEKDHYLEKLNSIRGIEPVLVQAKDFEYLSKWYISAIRELLLVNKLRDNCEKIASMIIPPLTTDEVREAIDILKKTNLVRSDIHGYLVPRNTIIKKDPSVKSTLWKTFMKEKVKLGTEAIDRFQKDQRDISEVCIPLSESSFAEVKDEIDKLRKKLLVLSEKDKFHNRVFQCNIQLFPLTEKFGSDAIQQKTLRP